MQNSGNPKKCQTCCKFYFWLYVCLRVHCLSGFCPVCPCSGRYVYSLWISELHAQCAAVCCAVWLVALLCFWALIILFFIFIPPIHQSHNTTHHLHALYIHFILHLLCHVIASTSRHAFWWPRCLVSLQSRKASEQAKSIECKTDSIGSGRAIPIKQVSARHLHTFFLNTGKYLDFWSLFNSSIFEWFTTQTVRNGSHFVLSWCCMTQHWGSKIQSQFES